MKFLRELYDSSFNYVKKRSYIMRYLNELILKGGVKHVSLLVVISINFDHMFYFLIFNFIYLLLLFFMHADALAELVLKTVHDIVRMSFSMQ